jgi:hypothetical protein
VALHENLPNLGGNFSPNSQASTNSQAEATTHEREIHQVVAKLESYENIVMQKATMHVARSHDKYHFECVSHFEPKLLQTKDDKKKSGKDKLDSANS